MTYSIVARDPETGELGVAVQSRAFNTGAVVPWGAPGVGVVATQSYTDPAYGPLGLDLLRAGKSPEQALAALVAADDDSAYRQVAILDAEGRVAVHVGAACIPAAGFAVGDGFGAQANMVDSERVWESMAEAFERADGPLAERLLAALDAAEDAGGDWRGRQAGGIVVVGADGQPWEREVDLRVDDHPDPLGELRRLLRLRGAYRAMRGPPGPSADDLAVLPELDRRWAAIFGATAAGRLDDARELFRPLLESEPRWAEFVRSLADRELLPNAAELLDG
ncbi:MAG TPA: DUF1028 domain-containing protein [Gaiellaceae bacterium]|nr:DUF1028 domain-containing protein [Gaiellaceae bacterium]